MSDQLTLLEVDGHTVDRLVIKFSGSVELDLGDDTDVEMYQQLLLGGRAAFLVYGDIAAKATAFKPATDDKPSEVTRTATMKVDSLGDNAVEQLREILTRDGMTATFHQLGREPVTVG